MERGPPQNCSFALPQKLGGPETPRSGPVGTERAAGSRSLASPGSSLHRLSSRGAALSVPLSAQSGSGVLTLFLESYSFRCAIITVPRALQPAPRTNC